MQKAALCLRLCDLCTDFYGMVSEERSRCENVERLHLITEDSPAKEKRCRAPLLENFFDHGRRDAHDLNTDDQIIGNVARSCVIRDIGASNNLFRRRLATLSCSQKVRPQSLASLWTLMPMHSLCEMIPKKSRAFLTFPSCTFKLWSLCRDP
jgi:hypothetical protein